MWNKYVITKKAIEIFTPSETPIDPNPKTKKPAATKINPKPYLKAADGLYFDSHNFETVEANAIMKNEFNVENHDTVISEASLENSFFNIHNAAPQMIRKHVIKITLDRAILLQVAFANFIKTQEIMINGTTVNNPLMMLKVVKADPVRLLSI